MSNSTSKKARFYLAEDIRLDQNNKPMIIGLYPQDKVIITLPPELDEFPKEKGVIIPYLSILTNLTGFSGKFKVKFSLFLPNGHNIMAASPPEQYESLNDNPYRDASIVMKFSPFKVTELGIYKFVVESGRTKKEFSFSIETEF